MDVDVAKDGSGFVKKPARSLRTQQRAWADFLATIPVPAARSSCTRGVTAIGRPTGQCSTLELHRSMNICAWAWTSELARCSLERR